MGWGRYLMFGNFGQQLDLAEHEANIDDLRQKLTNQSVDTAQIQRLTSEVNELKLYIATIFRVLVSRKIISQDDLRNLIHIVDGEDGAVDGAYYGDTSAAGEP